MMAKFFFVSFLFHTTTCQLLINYIGLTNQVSLLVKLLSFLHDMLHLISSAILPCEAIIKLFD